MPAYAIHIAVRSCNGCIEREKWLIRRATHCFSENINAIVGTARRDASVPCSRWCVIDAIDGPRVGIREFSDALPKTVSILIFFWKESLLLRVCITLVNSQTTVCRPRYHCVYEKSHVSLSLPFHSIYTTLQVAGSGTYFYHHLAIARETKWSKNECRTMMRHSTSLLHPLPNT
jgi:hypothetical protein